MADGARWGGEENVACTLRYRRRAGAALAGTVNLALAQEPMRRRKIARRRIISRATRLWTSSALAEV
jgi:hypothetical protein